MKIKCQCCGNDNPKEMFDCSEFTMCMNCGSTNIVFVKEEDDKEELIFFD